MKHARVLIVEDDDGIRELCETLLLAEGFRVETCKNGKEALKALEQHEEPCLILLDMLMPVMNGREFMTIFTKKPHTLVPIPVYLVSATAHTNDGKDMGCSGFLKKPFDCEALLSIVRAHCMNTHLPVTATTEMPKVPPENLISRFPKSKKPPLPRRVLN